MKKSLVAVAVAMVCALLVPVTALAASVPRFTSDSIVPDSSIGGLKLDAPATTAKAIFGAKACNGGGCSYSAPDGSWTFAVVFAAKTKTSKPFIGQISYSVLKVTGSVPKLETASGIGIGSTPAAVKKAYPQLLGSPKLSFYTRNKLPSTSYGFANGHLASIEMRAINVG